MLELCTNCEKFYFRKSRLDPWGDSNLFSASSQGDCTRWQSDECKWIRTPLWARIITRIASLSNTWMSFGKLVTSFNANRAARMDVSLAQLNEISSRNCSSWSLAPLGLVHFRELFLCLHFVGTMLAFCVVLAKARSAIPSFYFTDTTSILRSII